MSDKEIKALNTVYASAAVLIDQKKRILIAQRPPHKKIMPGYWEFPGGKLNEGETPEQALHREIREEIDIGLGAIQPLVFISEDRQDYHVIVYVFSCYDWQGDPKGMENQEVRWVAFDELHNINLLPSNYKVLESIKRLINESAY